MYFFCLLCDKISLVKMRILWEGIILAKYKSNAKERRIKLGNKLGIGYGNANQMLSRLNNYGITKEEFIEAIKYVDEELEGNK